MKRYLIHIFLLLFFAFCFSKSLLKINSADILKQDPSGGKIIYGNVDIEYDIYRVKCDSAVINKDLTAARLYNNVEFSDTARVIRCRKATITKSPSGRRAFLYGDVSVKEKDLYVTGKEASLDDVIKNITLRDSVIVRYYDFPSILFCNSISINTKTEIITSNTIDSVFAIDSLRAYRLYTKSCVYDTKASHLKIPARFELEAREFENAMPEAENISPSQVQEIRNKRNYDKEMFFSADRGIFDFERTEYSTSGKCRFVRIDSTVPDTLTFTAPEIKYSEKLSLAQALNGVKVIKGQMSVISRDAFYLTEDEIIKLSGEPEIFFRNYSAAADSMEISVDAGELYPDKAVLFGYPEIISISKDNENEQEKDMIKGRRMDISFKKEKIDKIIVSKEAEALYFIRKGRENLAQASNYILGDTLEIIMNADGIDKASIKGGSEGIYFPGELKLKGLKKIED